VNILEWIGVEQQNVGEFASFNAAQVVFPSEKSGWIDGCGLQRLGWRESCTGSLKHLTYCDPDSNISFYENCSLG
jgi:hypothetical protein